MGPRQWSGIEVVGRQAQSAHDLAVGTQLGGDDPNGKMAGLAAGGGRQPVTAELLADAGEDRLPGEGGIPADDDHRRVQQVAGVGEDSSEGAARVGEQPGDPGLVGLQGILQPVGEDLVPGRGVQPPADGGGGDHRLETAPAAAAARVPLGHDDDMAELAGDPRAAAEQPPTADQTGTDPGGQLDVDQVVDLAGDTGGTFSERTEVRVVVDGDGHPETGLEGRRDGRAAPPGEHHRGADRAAGAVDRSGNPGAAGNDLGPLHACIDDGTFGKTPGDVQSLVHAGVDVDGFDVGDQDPTGQVADRHADVLVTEVEAEDHARVPRQPHHLGASAGPGRLGGSGDDLDDAIVGETSHQSGHRRAGEARPRGDLCPGHDGPRAERIDHPLR